MLVEMYTTYINFMIVSVVAMLGYKSYLETSKQTTKGRLRMVAVFAMILLTLSCFFIGNGLIMYEKFDFVKHYVPAASLVFIFFMQLTITYNVYRKDRAILDTPII